MYKAYILLLLISVRTVVYNTPSAGKVFGSPCAAYGSVLIIPVYQSSQFLSVPVPPVSQHLQT